ncbi:MAG: S-methyl-5-thioribose-1-phosphate isomerase [Abditibacteriales bacterium]|nr:S-methyl-5-thioribose-1-phosphate isomerase [Abditibacteriales bacterium]
MSTQVKTIQWHNGIVRMIDQTRLPHELVFCDCENHHQVAEAIKTLKIRGAPAIGVAAAFGLALCAHRSSAQTTQELLNELRAAEEELARTRPTAVNLFWALRRMMNVAQASSLQSVAALKAVLLEEAQAICDEDVAMCRAIGQHGAALLPPQANVLTHCNAGALATAGYGTALGVIRAAVASGKKVHVFADETRPVLQGARLTAWELLQDGIPTTLLTDNMAAQLMRQGQVDAVIVGADRIAANGDVANKIGTYGLAVLARYHQIPFYVAAPFSTIDLSLSSGADIPIEERSPQEVLCVGAQPIAPVGIRVINPAFDVTPHDLVTAIITERGVVKPPYEENLRRVSEQQ